MSRNLTLHLNMTVADDVDDLVVADFIFDLLVNDISLPTAIRSIDGVHP